MPWGDAVIMRGDDFRRIREGVLNLSVAQMAEVLNVIPRTVRYIEAPGGQATGPTVVLMNALCVGRLPEIPKARRGAGRPAAGGDGSAA